MPTYTVTSPEGRLSTEQRGRIAKEITRIHHEVTGAPAYFAQVLFTEVVTGAYYVGGSPLDTDQIFVLGQIRAGRSAEHKHALIIQLTEAIAAAADMPLSHAWTYIAELPAAQMVEFGKVLPMPGDERSWIASFPDADRQRLESIGRADA